MNTILDEIVSHKKEEVKLRKQKGISDLKESEMFFRTPISLRSALLETKLSIGVIAEIKRKSPSAGIIREDFSAKEIAKEYEENSASAISVLTDERYFGGSLNDLENVRNVVSIPLLRKDFIIDQVQIYEAKSFGADAILLIADILSRQQLEDLFFCAKENGLECLVEVYKPHSLEKINFDEMRLLGINNRNLKTMKVNLKHTEEIISFLPKDICVVSESGIKTSEDVLRVKNYGAKAILIGETLMKEKSPGKALKELVEGCTGKI
ncbi:MAG: indole-3-glycerol phosphate synthase TrpC [Ignavibacteriales bacterium]|nr:indole-3-glycerol phosphate synthase TrpC [Ignavibacteriales bacterium]